MKFRNLILITLVFILSCESSETSLDLRSRVRRLTLDNGMKVLLLKRQGAPVFSTQMKLKVGNIEEEEGSYGLAHFFEHMAFKGTKKIGTKDFAAEKKVMDEIDTVGTMIVALKKQGKTEADEEFSKLLKKRRELEKKHSDLMVKNEFTQTLQRNGGVSLNATTSNDFTTYYVSLPANKMEMWAYMESQRFINPVMRGFFTEVDVVAEERRMRIDNTPQGRLYEALVGKAFDNSPYKTVVIGPPEDIQHYTPKVAQAFYDKYYIPSRMVLSIVGNFELDEGEKIVRKYFSAIPAKEDPVKKFAEQKFDKSFPRSVEMK